MHTKNTIVIVQYTKTNNLMFFGISEAYEV